VGQFLRAFVVIVVAVALATVLLTPDPNDDVSGLLHQQRVKFFLALQSLFLQAVGSYTPVRTADMISSSSRALELVDWTCVRLC